MPSPDALPWFPCQMHFQSCYLFVAAWPNLVISKSLWVFFTHILIFKHPIHEVWLSIAVFLILQHLLLWNGCVWHGSGHEQETSDFLLHASSTTFFVNIKRSCRRTDSSASSSFSFLSILLSLHPLTCTHSGWWDILSNTAVFPSSFSRSYLEGSVKIIFFSSHCLKSSLDNIAFYQVLIDTWGNQWSLLLL